MRNAEMAAVYQRARYLRLQGHVRADAASGLSSPKKVDQFIVWGAKTMSCALTCSVWIT
jgi:hypothetical protein